MKKISLLALAGIPLIQEGDDLGAIICEAAKRAGFAFAAGDVVVVASKIASKAEGRLVDTDTVKPSSRARALAKVVGGSPSSMEVILRETKRVLIARPGFLLTEHRLGFICTKAGVDSSNTDAGPKGKTLALLPRNPDASAKGIRATIRRKTGKRVAVVINDTFGRSDRKGSVGMAVGVAGMPALHVPASRLDIHGKQRHPELAMVDELAAAGSLLMGQTNERRPVIVVRGVDYRSTTTSHLRDLLHPTTKFIRDAADVAGGHHRRRSR